MTRRFFIGGALSSAALAGCRGFWTPAGRAGADVPRLRFGVLSDIHVLGANAAPEEFNELRGDTRIFEATLRWFDRQKVDAVMISGDLADYGMVEELEEVAKAWERVFPGNRAADGRPVEKLFTSGNHEINGFLYDDYAQVKFVDPVERRRHVLRGDFARHWERILGEPYRHFFRKDVKGYPFLSTHWGDDTDMSVGWCKNHFGVELQAYLDAEGARLDPRRPFFYFQHPHLKDTCFGAWAWGRDDGKATAALAQFPRAVAFSGHAHYPLTDERAIWQGAFASIGASSLRFAEMPHGARVPFGYENSGGTDISGGDANEVKTTPPYPQGSSQQGLLVDVYDDRLVVSRREFPAGTSLGDDWVMPLDADRPFAFAARARQAKAPQFAADAQLEVSRVMAKTRGKKPVEKAALAVGIPAALAEKAARPFEYELAVEGAAGERRLFHVLASGFNSPVEAPEVSAVTRMTLSLDRLPPHPVRVTVMPLDCWWNRGRGLSSAQPLGSLA